METDFLKMAVSITNGCGNVQYSLAPIRLLGLIRFLLWRPTGPLQSPIAPEIRQTCNEPADTGAPARRSRQK